MDEVFLVVKMADGHYVVVPYGCYTEATEVVAETNDLELAHELAAAANSTEG